MKFNVNKRNVGLRIRQIRNNLNLTLEEFGKIFSSNLNNKLNAGKSNVSTWERGDSLPNKQRLEIIAKKGNISVDELLYGDIKEFVTNNFGEFLKEATKPEYINDRFTKNDLDNLKSLFFEKYNSGKDKDFDINYILGVFRESYNEYLESRISSINKNLKIIDSNIDLARHCYNHNLVGNTSTRNYFKVFFIPFYVDIGVEFDFDDETKEEMLKAESLSFVIDKMKDNIETRDVFIYSGILNELVFFMNKDDSFDSDEIDIIFQSQKIEILSFDELVNAIDNSELGVPIGEEYEIPLKVNKYNLINYKNLYGLYIAEIDSTFVLANYIDFETLFGDNKLKKVKKEYYEVVNDPDLITRFNSVAQEELKDKLKQLNDRLGLVPLNTEADYFILNRDNTYQISKITEIPDCKYISPIIGRLE